MNTYELISICLYFSLMLAIGYYSYRKSANNVEGFLLGGRKLGPVVTALSAGAADMSGWLLMGLPGAMFTQGLSASWMAIGLTVGAYLNYLTVAPRLRVYTEKANNSITLPDYFENRFMDKTKLLRFFSAIIILIFFTLYTSSGMVAGGRLFESSFGLDYNVGLIVTSSVVILYTLFGGFLAVSLTDFVQGVIMVTALVLIPTVAIMQVGGLGETFQNIELLDPKKLSFFEGTTTIGILSLAAWGFGYFGQPHILVRFMAIDSVKGLTKARRVGISWMIFSVGGAMFIGLVGFAFLAKYPDTIDRTTFDPETIFILFSKILFHPLITGFLLSAILAAVMSTISSQLLVTSSSLTQDFYKPLRKKASEKELVLVSRLSVLLVAIIALILSLSPSDTILDLVGHAWAGFGASFGSVILISLFWKRMTMQGALAGMLTGGAVVLLWVFGKLPAGLKEVYEMIPGFFAAVFMIIVVSLLTQKPDKTITDTFDSMVSDLKK